MPTLSPSVIQRLCLRTVYRRIFRRWAINRDSYQFQHFLRCPRPLKEGLVSAWCITRKKITITDDVQRVQYE